MTFNYKINTSNLNGNQINQLKNMWSILDSYFNTQSYFGSMSAESVGGSYVSYSINNGLPQNTIGSAGMWSRSIQVKSSAFEDSTLAQNVLFHETMHAMFGLQHVDTKKCDYNYTMMRPDADTKLPFLRLREFDHLDAVPNRWGLKINDPNVVKTVLSWEPNSSRAYIQNFTQQDLNNNSAPAKQLLRDFQYGSPYDIVTANGKYNIMDLSNFNQIMDININPSPAYLGPSAYSLKPNQFNGIRFNQDINTLPKILIQNKAIIHDVIGGSKNDTITGNSLANKISSGDDNDIIRGNAGNDTLDGGAGNDTVDGGPGNDRIFVSTGADVLTGGDGIDTLDFSSLTDGVNVNFEINQASKNITQNNILSNPSFEANRIPSNARPSQQVPAIDGWKPIAGASHIELWNSKMVKALGVKPSDGDQAIEIDVTPNKRDGIYQDVLTQKNSTYVFSIDAAASIKTKPESSELEIVWNNTVVATINPTKQTMQTYTFDVIGTGGLDRIEIRETSAGDGRSGEIDNLKLQMKNSSVSSNLFASIIGFENINGTKYNDFLTGDQQNNVLYGDDGDDVLFWSRARGNDTFDGGNGRDTLSLLLNANGAVGYNADWIINLKTGHYDVNNINKTITLSDNAEGTINFLNGAKESLTFTHLETIVWA